VSQNWNKSIHTLRRLTGKMTMQYEPAAKPNKLVLASEGKRTLSCSFTR
jgi:hypothetical protein